MQLVSKAPFGAINGWLYFYVAHDLADGFDRSPIPDTQTAPATFSYISYKFFKAAIHAYLPGTDEEPWEEW